MSEEIEGQSDEQALASMMAGYNSTRGDTPPVIEEPTAEVGNEAATADEPSPVVEAQPSITDLAQELKDLKAKVSAANGGTEVRRLHGEIGNINRTLQQLQQSKKAELPDDLDAALTEAEKVAEEFPELAGPLVKALKSSIARNRQPEDIDSRVMSAVAKQRQEDAREALAEEHPDYAQIAQTKEYQTWLASKTPEFRERFTTTWNPAVVSRGLTEFKDSLKSKAQKQNVLAAAVVPKGVPQRAAPSVLPDEAGLWAGYYGKNNKQQLKGNYHGR